MANLKRNMIKLVKNPEEAIKGGEVEYETFWTSPFLPTSVTYEAMDLADLMEEQESEMKSRDVMDMLATFVSDKIYGGQFTIDELKDKFHGPDFVGSMREQVQFIAQGQQTDETKNFLAKRK